MATGKKKEGLKEKGAKKKEKGKIPFIVLVVSVFVIGVVVGYILHTYLLLSKLSSNRISENERIDTAIKDYIRLYLGLINVSVNNKTFDSDENIWTADVSAISATRKVNLEVFIYDSNLSIKKIVEKIPLPEKPVTIIEIPKKISCSFENKTAIDIYIDPYDKWSRNYDNLIEEFLNRFNKSISPIWRIVQTSSYRLRQENSNTTFALLYFECVKNKRIFPAFKKCVYDKYEAEKVVLGEKEIEYCLNESGKNILTKTDIDEIKNCTQVQGYRELSVDESFGNTYLEEITTPMIVIDCKYKTWPTFIDKVMCYLYPQLDECKNIR